MIKFRWTELRYLVVGILYPSHYLHDLNYQYLTSKTDKKKNATFMIRKENTSA